MNIETEFGNNDALNNNKHFYPQIKPLFTRHEIGGTLYLLIEDKCKPTSRKETSASDDE